jgi:uncharacterized membrane protein
MASLARRTLVFVATLLIAVACKPAEDASVDTATVVSPAPARDSSRPATQASVPEDTGPPDTPQVLALQADRKRRGVDFFGVGQEPGWMIEIDDGKRLYLLANYMEDTVDVVAPAPASDPAVPGKRVYRATSKAHTLVVTIEPRPCSDAMSAKRYPETVTVTLDGKTNGGCGRRIE